MEIDDFAKHEEDGDKKHYGMMQAGGEEKIIKELKTLEKKKLTKARILTMLDSSVMKA